jgi:hypothetical protein
MRVCPPQYPEGYLETQAAKEKEKENKSEPEEETPTKGKRKRKSQGTGEPDEMIIHFIGDMGLLAIGTTPAFNHSPNDKVP